MIEPRYVSQEKGTAGQVGSVSISRSLHLNNDSPSFPTLKNMDTHQEQLYAQAEELVGYNALSLKAMALWASEHSKDKEAMRIASFCWGRNARHMAKAVSLFGNLFRENDRTASDYLTLFAIASVSKYERGMLYEDWRGGSLNNHQVQARVREMKQPKVKEKQDKRCPYCNGVLP